jgi:hypothetical protein
MVTMRARTPAVPYPFLCDAPAPAGIASAGASAAGRAGRAMGRSRSVDLGEVLGQGGDAGVFVEQGRRQPQPRVVVQPLVQRNRQQRVQAQLDEPQVRLGDRSVQLLHQQLLQVADENSRPRARRTTTVQPGPQAPAPTAPPVAETGRAAEEGEIAMATLKGLRNSCICATSASPFCRSSSR